MQEHALRGDPLVYWMATISPRQGGGFDLTIRTRDWWSDRYVHVDEFRNLDTWETVALVLTEYAQEQQRQSDEQLSEARDPST